MKQTGLITLILFLLFACSKKDDGRIPDVFVSFRANLNDPRISKLNSAGGAVIIEGQGVAGLIIYRRPDNSYIAFDRCSSVNPERKCAVTLDDPSLTATDPCSGAKFSLFDGAPVKDPAKRPLKQYQVTISSFEISVTN
ncbi:MAG TPA: Rieske (2Fe-2S) protein [Sphingobacteriaceae bacterium]|nr:Rieske (2Fe-2S) protein [Sphingobacteriaceae bacterium]